MVPTYNEAANIDSVLERISKALEDATVLVVDDASPDGTADIVRRRSASVGGVELLERQGKQGLGSAYRDGFRWGLQRGFDAMVEMDADLSHDPAALPSLVGALGGGIDLVIGSRYVPGGSIPAWSWSRRVLSRTGNLYSAVMLGLGVADLTSGFRVYSAALLERMDFDAVRADGYGFQIEMVYRAARLGAQVVEVPISFTDRVEGTSKMSMRTIVEALALVTIWGVKARLGRLGSLAGRYGRRGWSQADRSGAKARRTQTRP